MKRIPVLALALLIGGGPAVAQFLRVENPIFRPWKMYGTVAIGAAFGDFKISQGDTTYGLITMPEALGLAGYREQQPYPGSGAIVRDLSGPDALPKVAAPICDRLTRNESLSFSGRIATRDRWVFMELNHQSLCESEN